MVQSSHRDARTDSGGPTAAAGRTAERRFEADYVRAQLLANRTLIRAACTLALVLAGFRAAEQGLAGWWTDVHLGAVAFILASSVILAAVAWHRRFPRYYLPIAQVLVPIRNCVGAACIADAASQGQLESLVFLPLMVLGPAFFLGLRYRAALATIVLTVTAFVACAAVLAVPLPIALRASLFLALSAAACLVAARHRERASRSSFLDSRLLAQFAQNDSLTGLKNRRVFDEHLDRLWEQALGTERGLAILMIDVDHFKAYNDVYGHQAGDQTLRRIAQALQTFVYRPNDVLARYGGEEFAVILCDVAGPEVEATAERMRRAVNGLGIEHRGSDVGAEVSISVGIALVEPSSTAAHKARCSSPIRRSTKRSCAGAIASKSSTRPRTSNS